MMNQFNTSTSFNRNIISWLRVFQSLNNELSQFFCLCIKNDKQDTSIVSSFLSRLYRWYRDLFYVAKKASITSSICFFNTWENKHSFIIMKIISWLFIYSIIKLKDRRFKISNDREKAYRYNKSFLFKNFRSIKEISWFYRIFKTIYNILCWHSKVFAITKNIFKQIQSKHAG